MRFKPRKYRTLLRTRKDNFFAECNLTDADDTVATFFKHDPKFVDTDEIFHSAYQDVCAAHFSNSSQLLGINLVTETGAQAFVGEYSVNVEPKSSTLEGRRWLSIVISVTQSCLVPGTSSGPLIDVADDLWTEPSRVSSTTEAPDACPPTRQEPAGDIDLDEQNSHAFNDLSNKLPFHLQRINSNSWPG